eukprot:1911543-Prymnesium_polylepis.1
MVYAHLGDITSMDVTKMGTVLAIRAGGRAGAVLPPAVLAAGASESALRRNARAAFAALETLLEREGLEVSDMASRDIESETAMLRTVAEIYRKHATPIVVSGEDGGAGVIPGGAQQAVRWADAAGAPAPAAGLDAQRAA